MVDLSNTFDVLWRHGSQNITELTGLEQQRWAVTKAAMLLRRKGWTYAKIGLELGYTRQYIYYLLKKKRAKV